MRRPLSGNGFFGLAFLTTLGAWLALAGVAEARHKANRDDDDDNKSDKAASGATSPDGGPKAFRFDFGLTAGAHFFDSQSGLGRFTDSPADVSPKSTVAFGGRLGLNFTSYVTLEGEFLWIPTHTVLADPDGTTINVFAYRGNILVHLAPPGIVRPFILVGYGALTSISKNTSVSFNDTNGVFHGGLGVKFALGDYVGLRLDGRVLAPPAALGTKYSVDDKTGFHGPDWEALGTLYFNFGEIEKVEVIKEERVVVEKTVAAPANPDPDGDGISGAADKCPNAAEDKDGFEDEDGCPDPDNDNDGVPDLRDKCPNEPEDKDGFEDEDGCPDPDNDGDGIPDTRDKCPNEPETKNGYKDDDGCPDEIPAAIKKFTGVIEGINFKSGRATILPGSYAVLDRAIAALKDYPEIRLEISGHTDARGKADRNRDLSQARADAVKLYFISRGIDESRLTSIGYGSEHPLDTNRTDAGRAANRRTEFRILTGQDKP